MIEANRARGTEEGPAKPETYTRPPSPEPLPSQGRTGAIGYPGAELHRSWALRRALAAGDWLALIVALTAVTWLGSDINVSMLFWALFLSPVWVLLVKLHGLYDFDHRRIRHSTLDEVPRLISATAIGVLVLVGALGLAPTGAPAAGTAALIGAFILPLSFSFRALIRQWWHWRTPAGTGIVVGPADTSGTIARRLSTNPESRLDVIGFLAPANQSSGSGRPDADTETGLPCLGTVVDLHDVAQTNGVERVVIADGGITALETEWLIGECKATGLSLTLVPHNYQLFGPTIELNRLAALPVLDFRFSPPPRSTMLLKRLMDVGLSATFIALTAPVLIAAAVAIKLDSRGPVFFRQRRAGKGGHPFTMLKLRTMVDGAESRLEEVIELAALDQPVFKIPGDPRITRVGRFLRRTSLDEMPQLINVLRGDMSLVGPRPEEEAVVALYSERQRVRLTVKPGMTGPMQVTGRGDLTFEERLALDRDYLDNISITGDLAILLRTPKAIVSGSGAY